MRAATDPSAKLVQLRQPEPLRASDKHDCRIRDINTHLDHGRRHQDIRFPFTEALHDGRLFSRGHLPVYQFHPLAGKHLCAQAMKHLLRRLQFRLRRFGDQRINKKSLPSFSDLLPDEIICLRQLILLDHPRDNFLPTLRHLVQDADIQVAVYRHRQRSRNRRSGHDQHVGLLTLFIQHPALLHPEFMLLINHQQPQPLEHHAVLDDRMRADKYVHVAPAYRIQQFPARALFHTGSQ